MPSADASLLLRPATELADLVRTGAVSAVELVRLAIERIEALDGRVNALVDLWAEDALAEAAAIRPGDPRPFAGVPTAMKDNRAVAGRRITYGAAIADTAATVDHHVTARLRAAGFVVLGSTNLPEFSVTPVTRGRRFGAARNPWDLERAAGGSSGGAAAAVASGMLPTAHGNDGGGSIRIPAAACGLVGLKPSRGRVPLGPDLGWHLLVCDGMLTRTVADAAATLDVLAGPEDGDLAPLPTPTRPFADEARRGTVGDVRPLRIGLTLDPALGIPASASGSAHGSGASRASAADPAPGPGTPAGSDGGPVASAADAAGVHRAADLLRRLGHDVEEVAAPWRIPGLLDLFGTAFGAGVASQVRAIGRRRGREVEAHEVESLTWALYQDALALPSVDLLLADAEIQGVARRVLTWAADYDVLLTPTLATAPPPVDALDPDGPDPRQGFADGALFSPFAAICNVTGQPAITLPLTVRPEGDDAAGMPVGTHLIGRPGGEAELLALAAQLEAAAGPAPIAPLART
ncbi:amidase [Patulibacter minatonensis]|uniref:amidase n=1 Tax=Patulibacter minatonensis TaxID=298163 RepID=UPI000478F503|nr:amidase [Patulibacter minatonensis]